MSFLKNEVESEERITMAFQGFSLGNNIRSMKPENWNPVVLTKMLFPPQPAFLIVNPEKWYVCSARGLIPMTLPLKHRKWALRRNGTSLTERDVVLRVSRLDTLREDAEPS
jgi:hypothetical protein